MSDENDKDGALMCHQLGRILSFLLGLGILPTQPIKFIMEIQRFTIQCFTRTVLHSTMPGVWTVLH